MINPPPHPAAFKAGIISAFRFMSKKNKVSNVFSLNINGFWDSCWIVFFVNVVVLIVAIYGGNNIIGLPDGNMPKGLFPTLLLITVIDICLFSIVVNFIFEKIGNPDAFYKFIIPFNWIQSFQAIVIIVLSVLGLILPTVVYGFFKTSIFVWAIYSLWRVGKEEVGLTGWGAIGMIFLSGIIEASLSTLAVLTIAS